MKTKDIIKQAADMYGVPVKAVLSPCRRRELSDCRAVICYVLVQRYRLSKSETGRIIGRTHADVIHHLAKANDWIEVPTINPRGAECLKKMLNQKPP